MIRFASARDAEAVADIYRPSVTDHATSFELEPPDAATMALRIEKTLARTPWLACEHRGEVLGYAYGGAHRERPAYQWTVEVSAYVRGDAHRMGIGRGLYTALLAVLELQGFRNAVAGIALPNDGSVALHQAMGFERVGVFHRIGFKFERWHDVAWFERGLGDPAAELTLPRPLPDLIHEPRLAAAMRSGDGLLRFAGAERAR